MEFSLRRQHAAMRQELALAMKRTPTGPTKRKGEDVEGEETSPKRRGQLKVELVAPPQDTPELSVARHEETLQVRRRMAELVKSLGPLNTQTKAGRFVARDGYFSGLAAMYGRWVFSQKGDEGHGPGLDPLLPSVAPYDDHHLPKELAQAGLSRTAALQVSVTLSELSQRAAQRLALLPRLPSQHVTVLRTEDGKVCLTCGTTSVVVADDRYRKLCSLWETTTGNQCLDERDDDIFCVLHRYEALSGSSPGFQMALSENVFDVLQRRWGVTHECFASPLNCYLPSYCSMFLDTDAPFGSKGSFFDFRPTEGSYEANPPFVEDTMTESARHILNLLQLVPQGCSAPLSFVLVVPGWDGDGCESYRLTTQSEFLRGWLTLEAKGHYYKHGMQHRMQGGPVYQLSTARTFVFFLQNEAGAARWPVTLERLEELREAFSSEPPPCMRHGPAEAVAAQAAPEG